MNAAALLPVSALLGLGQPAAGPLAPALGLLFVNPLPFPAGARLWMLLPLVACVAVVYRATRTRSVRAMAKPTVLTFVNIVVGMILIAAAFYGVHMLVRYVL